jgi:tetratricopeptide (TPR) repeat protein
MDLQELIDLLPEQHRQVLSHLETCETCRERLGEIADARRTAELLQRMAESGESGEGGDVGLGGEAAGGAGWDALAGDPRFHTAGVVERLVDLCRQEGRVTPERGEALAQMALALAEHLPRRAYDAATLADLRARAYGGLADARRAAGDLDSAARLLAMSYDRLRRGTRGALENAIHLEVKGALAADRHRPAAAHRLWNRALVLFEALGERRRAAHVLLAQAEAHRQAGDIVRGIAVLERAVQLTAQGCEPPVALEVRHRLIELLADAGRFDDAERLYSRTCALYNRVPDDDTQSYRKWVLARISRGLGHLEEAAALLALARQHFLARGADEPARRTGLDLAAVYAAQGRHADLARLRAEMEGEVDDEGEP